MKTKSKGPGGVVGLLLAHGEKIVIAAAVMCVGMLIMKSLSREQLPAERQAEKLQQQISMVRSEVTNFDWNKAVADHPTEVRQVKPVAEKDAGEIPPGAYVSGSWRTGWDSPVVPPTVLRTDPVMLDVQDVEVSSGSGLLVFTNEEIRKKREIERQMAQQQQAAAAQKQQDKEQKESEAGKRPASRTGRTAGAPIVEDPLHPKRRSVINSTRPMGVPQQEDEEIRTAYWAVVTAKVPIKDQIRLYHDAFQNARGYNPNTDDLPMYLGYLVERAEVTSSQQEPQWTRVPVTNGKGVRIGMFVNTDAIYGVPGQDEKKGKPGVVTDWAEQVPEVVDPRYLDPSGVLTFPLPPLSGRDWGRDVTHSEIPLATAALAAEARPQDAAEAAKPSATPEDDAFRAGSAESGAMGTRPGAGRPSGFGGIGGYSGRGEMGEGRGTAFRGEGGGRAMQGEGAAYGRGAMGASAAPEVPNWLFRFFDFTVEPGKKYKYRVKLVLMDPNQTPGVMPESLAPDALKRVKAEKAARKSPTAVAYRMTEFSKPSRAISIPQAGNVHVVSAKPPTGGSTAEPETTLLVESFGDAEGKPIQAALEDDFKRGYVANMTKDAEVLVEQGRYIDPVKSFKFRTGITIADISGGDKISRDLQRPGRVLLMDPAGQLFVKNEVDDQEVVSLHQDTFAKQDPKNPNATTGGRGPAMMGERGGR